MRRDRIITINCEKCGKEILTSAEVPAICNTCKIKESGRTQ
jgi:hypothetical protein